MTTRQQLIDIAHELDFDHVRFAAIGKTPRFTVFDDWISRGEHADMDWMTANHAVREDPRERLPNAKTVMVLGVQYAALDNQPFKAGSGRVARYAWGRDYHNFTGKRLKKLRKRLRELGIESWGGTDTAPILERAWAEAAGLGFNGKNGMSIIPSVGSWYTLAVLFIDTEVAPDTPVGDHCGSCTRCIDACPTNAISEGHDVDARKCLSYWTIESDSLPPIDIRNAMGDRAFGCDICQEVCPHNHGDAPPCHDDFKGLNQYLDISAIIRADDDGLMDQYIGTPLRRPKAAGLKRNAFLALANHPTDDTDELITIGLKHSDSLVNDAAKWVQKNVIPIK